MKLSKSNFALNALTLIGAASLFTGCLTKNEEEKTSSYESDGQSAYLTAETDQMGLVYDQIAGQAMGKSAAQGEAATVSGAELTIIGEKVIIPFAFQEACSCFVRTATYTGSNGFERERIDSVTLLDSSDAIMTSFRPARIAKIVHTRTVTRTKGDRQVDIRFDIVVDIKTEGVGKVGVWNGTMTGSYNGQEFKSGSIDQVVRPWENGRFRFPESGTIEVDRPVLHFLVTFLGEGQAKVRIRNKVTGIIHILYVDKDYNETAPVEQP